jgi:hypothetical protein
MSPYYLESVQQGAEFQKNNKSWAGYDVVKYQKKIKDLVVRYRATTILDYGCGKGLQYQERLPYGGGPGVDVPQETTVSTNTFISLIREVLIEKKYDITGTTAIEIAAMTFTYVFADSGDSNGSQLKSFENNYSTINLQEVYGDSFYEYINRKYFCVSRGSDKNIPIVSFISVKDFVIFAINRISGIVVFLEQDTNTFSQQFPNDPYLATVNNLAKQYVLRYPLNQNENVYTKITEDKNQISKLIAEITDAYKKFEILWK